MDWISNKCENKLFWHLTTKNTIEKIKLAGLKKSSMGQNGDGVYCIFAEDYDVLDSLVELFEQRGLNIDDLIIIEFNYSGDYEFCEKKQLIYSNEGWIVIKENIPSHQINKVIELLNI